MSGLPGRLLDTNFLRRSLASFSSGIVPEARLDFIDFATDLDEALGDLPTGSVEYALFTCLCFEPDEAIRGLSDAGFEERVGELKVALSGMYFLRVHCASAGAFHPHVEL